MSKKKKKKKQSGFSTILLLLIMIAGVGVLMYPTVADWWNKRHMTQAIETYVEQVASMEKTKKEQMLEEARAYNASLNTGVHFLSKEKNPEEYEEYMQILDITGTGIMGYIQIPSIGVNLPIFHSVEDNVLQIAVGHIPGTSLAVGGESTHAVLSGHRGLPSAKLFTDLDQLAEGDVFMINVLDETFTYEVDQIHIVLPSEVSDMAITTGKDYVTLVTCTPYGVNSHRMLVRGHRIDNLPEEVREILITSDAYRISEIFVMLGIAEILILCSLLISSIYSMIKSRRKSGDVLIRELKESMRKETEHEDTDV